MYTGCPIKNQPTSKGRHFISDQYFLRGLKESKVQTNDYENVKSNDIEMNGKSPKISFPMNMIFRKLPVRFLKNGEILSERKIWKIEF